MENRRAIVPAEGDMTLTFTTAQDVARVVAEAIDYQGVWPETGGINGQTLTNSELLKLAEEIRGMYVLAFQFKCKNMMMGDFVCMQAGKLTRRVTYLTLLYDRTHQDRESIPS